MKNALIFLLSLVLIASVVEAKQINSNVYQIPKTTVAPIIDGQQDNVWKSLDWNMQRLYTVDGAGADSGSGLAGMSKAMWDANNLYILFYSVDDIIIDIPANPSWNQDAIEIYVDGDNSKIADGVAPDPGSGLAPGDYQFTIPHYLMGNEGISLGTAFGLTIDTVGIEFKIRDVVDTEGFPGWMLEVKIPLASLGIDGASAADQLIGWELQQDESDDATIGRQSMSKWWGPSNNSWTDASLWGTAVLSSRVVDTVFEINKLRAADTAPVIDGTMDPIYRLVNPITTNLFRVDAAADVVNTDPIFGGFVTEYPIYDNNNLYIFFDVVDPIITDIATNPSWNQDAVEFYIDGDNSKIADGVAPDPGSGLAPGDYQFTIPHRLMGQEIGNLGTAFGLTIDTVGMEFKISDRDMRYNNGDLTQEGGGWNLEVKIPLAALGIDGASARNTLMGWELQQDNSNDATIGRQGMQKWWNATNNSWTDASIWGTAKLGADVEGTVGVAQQQQQQMAPVRYSLSQNYPNPFNPSTEITFTIAKTEKVKLSVYNLLGKEVAVLVNGTRNAGSQTVTFDAKNLSSGVYFYKLEAGSNVLAKKMMLLK